MSTLVLSGTYGSIITLSGGSSGTANDPTTITPTGLLEAGLYAESIPADWTVTNAGRVLGAGATLASTGTLVNSGSIDGGAAAHGVDLLAGGSVSNQSTGTISGYRAVYGGAAAGATTVTNQGAIIGGTTGTAGGIYLADGGVVTNQTSASISGRVGIAALGMVTVVNDGVISTGTAGVVGVSLSAGGSVTNNAGASISSRFDGIEAIGAAVTVVNDGYISANRVNSYGVALTTGSAVTNQSDGTIIAVVGIGNVAGHTGVVTVVNYGTVVGTGAGGIGQGIVIEAGAVTNHLGGLISGHSYGIGVVSAATTLVNYGDITGVLEAGLRFAQGGSVTNHAGGTISGAKGIFGAPPGAVAAATVVNQGAIVGGTTGADAGVVDLVGGNVTNQASASISGATGVTISGGAGTVVNAGTIIGNLGTAVTLAAGYANAVVLQPGASFTGVVIGGNTIGATTRQHA